MNTLKHFISSSLVVVTFTLSTNPSWADPAPQALPQGLSVSEYRELLKANPTLAQKQIAHDQEMLKALQSALEDDRAQLNLAKENLQKNFGPIDKKYKIEVPLKAGFSILSIGAFLTTTNISEKYQKKISASSKTIASNQANEEILSIAKLDLEKSTNKIKFYNKAADFLILPAVIGIIFLALNDKLFYPEKYLLDLKQIDNLERVYTLTEKQIQFVQKELTELQQLAQVQSQLK